MPGFKGYGGDDLPDPREVFEKLRQNLKFVIFGVVALLMVVAAMSSYYTVEADEHAIVLRFGVPTGELIGPGLHFRIPIVDHVSKEQTEKIRQLEFGFRTEKADVHSRIDEDSRSEGLMLTGDLELVNVQWTVLYRINDLQSYLFNVRDPEQTIRDVAEAQVRLLVGDRSSDEVMTIRRDEVSARGQELIQESLDRSQTGVYVESVALRQVEPPKEAREAFNKVNEARAKKQQRIEMAKREKEARVSPMRGRKEAIIERARGNKARVIAEARGEAARFLSILKEYRERPEMTRQWLYLQSLQRVWSHTGRKFILDGEGDGSTLRLLPLGDLGLGGSGGSGGDAQVGAPTRPAMKDSRLSIPSPPSMQPLSTASKPSTN